ncbi:MAG: response regulator [Desulfobulbaceae bacterium]|jgi:DNA-binding NtrC family response regulator|nr:response regulator [Desulfobulbaceae bacterium]MDY0350147.1 response regulator [Desulfobulbaceae bacterium]
MEPFNLLLVDDEAQFVETIARRLRKRGFTVDCASSGSEALEFLAENEAVDVIVLDIMMPDMDGIQTLEKVKEKYPLVEVIMLTGHATVPSAIESLKDGAFDYLIKPCELQVLIAKAEQAAARKREREARILDVRMTPYITDRERNRLITEILES